MKSPQSKCGPIKDLRIAGLNVVRNITVYIEGQHLLLLFQFYHLHDD